MSDIIDQINEACVGYPYAKIAWPHRLLHDARDTITTLRARVSELLRFNNEFEARAREAERIHRMLTTARPISEYHDDMGAVLWWKFPIVEAPYVGSPNDLGHEVAVKVETTIAAFDNQRDGEHLYSLNVGGWPGYHTHFTPICEAVETNR